jgi:hypothetical protein
MVISTLIGCKMVILDFIRGLYFAELRIIYAGFLKMKIFTVSRKHGFKGMNSPLGGV